MHTYLNSKESRIIFHGGMVRGSSLGFTIVSLTLLMFLLFSVFAATGGELTPKRVFTTLSLLIVLRLTTVHFFVQNVLAMTEGRVAVVRLQVGSQYANVKYCKLEDNTIYKFSPLSHFITRNYLRWRSWQELNKCWQSKEWRQNQEVFHCICCMILETTCVKFWYYSVEQAGECVESTGVVVKNLSASWSSDKEKIAISNISFQVDQVPGCYFVLTNPWDVHFLYP